MQVRYGSADLGLCELNEFSIEAAYDDTGRDFLCHDVHLAVSCPLNPFATATGKAPPVGPGGGFGAEGDRLGITIPTLKDLLQTPRQNLVVTIGSDVALQSPELDDATGEPLSCDIRGGPFPGKMRITGNEGDKTARLHWDVRTSVSPCANYLLANRWEVSANTDQEAFSTRTVTGTAYFRKDYLDDEGVLADGFRPWLIVPCPPTMQRKSIEVSVSGDETQLSYRVVDAEQNFGVGNYGITRIEGNVTVGSELSVAGTIAGSAAASISSAAAGGGVSGWLARGFLRVFPTHAGPVGTAIAAGIAGSMINLPKANGVARVWGQRWIDKTTLVQAGIAAILDRFRPLGTAFKPLSCFCTQDIGSPNAPFVEVRLEALALNLNAFKLLLDTTNVSTIMNFTSVYSIWNTPPAVDWGPNTPTPEMPESYNTRGSWIGALAIAALKASACTLPAAPTDPGNAEDTTGPF